MRRACGLALVAVIGAAGCDGPVERPDTGRVDMNDAGARDTGPGVDAFTPDRDTGPVPPRDAGVDAFGETPDAGPTEACGDGTIQGTEVCDDGNTAPGDGCSDACAVEDGFDCTGEPSDCTTTCGDGTMAGTEACDDGNTVTETACEYGTASCTGCSAACDLALSLTGATCGDGRTLGGTETCDDMNTTAGDGCSATCAAEMGFGCSGEPSVCSPRCGDGMRVGSEACDDGNTTTETCAYGVASCTVCSATCTSIPGAVAFCGDGVVGGPELCDDGNMTSGDGCEVGCTVTTGWTCAPGSPSSCRAVCGDGRIAAGAETCDDSNTAAGDGCSASCATETAWTCTGTPSTCRTTCGDALRASSELCDDGNTTAGDGCSASCTIESGFGCSGAIGARSTCAANCGNGAIDAGETCDDADTNQTDGCAFCQVQTGFTCTGVGAATVCTAVCGDGVVASTETCDDGWRSIAGATGGSRDGCSATCAAETGWTCAGSPSICTRNLSYTGGIVPINDNGVTEAIISDDLASCTIRTIASTSLYLMHSYVGDLTIRLVSPTDRIVPLVDRPNVTSPACCGSGSDLLGTYTFTDDPTAPAFPEAPADPVPAISYRATGDLGVVQSMTTALAGGAAGGTWILRIADQAALDTGSYGVATIRYTCRPN